MLQQLDSLTLAHCPSRLYVMDQECSSGVETHETHHAGSKGTLAMPPRKKQLQPYGKFDRDQ